MSGKDYFTPLILRVLLVLKEFKEAKRELTDDMLLMKLGPGVTKRDLLHILMKLELNGMIRVERIKGNGYSSQYKIRILQ